MSAVANCYSDPVFGKLRFGRFDMVNGSLCLLKDSSLLPYDRIHKTIYTL